MLLGRPLRAEISRSGSASPVERNADSSCAECTTDFTRYGSRVRDASSELLMRGIIPQCFAQRNVSIGMRNSPAVLRLVDVRKAYGAVRALRGVSFDLLPGDVHALVG